MFKNIKNFINKVNGANYDPSSHAGKFGSDGSTQPDQPTSEPSGFAANDNTAGKVNVDGGNNLTTPSGVEVEILSAQNKATQEMLGQPQVSRPSKNAYRNVDQELANQYYSNMETR